MVSGVFVLKMLGSLYAVGRGEFAQLHDGAGYVARGVQGAGVRILNNARRSPSRGEGNRRAGVECVAEKTYLASRFFLTSTSRRRPKASIRFPGLTENPPVP